MGFHNLITTQSPTLNAVYETPVTDTGFPAEGIVGCLEALR
jgi:hypothetical protein